MSQECLSRERNEACARLAELEHRVEGWLYRDVARIAGDTLEDGTDLQQFMPGVADMLDDDGMPDPERDRASPGGPARA